MKTLVLGGTSEARQLAQALAPQATLSLAGVTQAPLATPHRVGGFGGAQGLATYLQAGGFQAVVDATHPFATQMSQNACEASKQCGLPMLRLARPPWRAASEWQMVNTLNAAAQALPQGARAFLSVGSQSLSPFLGHAEIWCLTRSIEPPLRAPMGEVILQRPPFLVRDELALMAKHKITHLVCKNAGGGATGAKLKAAAQLGVQVIMVKRPRLSAALTVETVAKAVKWVENLGE